MDLDGNGSIDRTQSSVTVLNADGSTTVTQAQAAGTTPIGRTVTTTNATGLSKTVQVDLDGNGSFDLIETDTIALNADGTRTETLRDRNADGSTRSVVVTVTSADGKTVTASSYAGASATASMITTTVTQADGSRVSTTRQGDVTLTRTTDAQGLSSSVALSRPPRGAFDALTARSQTATTVLNADGSRTETVHVVNDSRAAPFAYDGESQDMTTTTITSRDGLSVTTARTGSRTSSVVRMTLYPNDMDFRVFGEREGAVDLTQTATDITVLAPDGGHYRQSIIHGSGNWTSGASRTVSGNGLQVTDELDADGNAVADLRDQTITNADGSVTETKRFFGSAGSQTIVTRSANGRSLSLLADGNADGVTDLRETVGIDPTGETTDTVSTTGTAATYASRTSSVVSANGLSRSTTYEGTGYDSRISVFAIANADGSLTTQALEVASSSSLLDRVVTTRSANGLSISASIDTYGRGTFDETMTDVTQVAQDGSTVRTMQTTYADGTLAARTVMTMSADGLTTTTRRDIDGNGSDDLVVTTTKRFDGETVTTLENARSGAATVTTVSADGLQTVIDNQATGSLTRITQLADGFGSYNVTTAPPLYRSPAGHDGIVNGITTSETHVIDANGMDTISTGVGSTPSAIYHKSVA